MPSAPVKLPNNAPPVQLGLGIGIADNPLVLAVSNLKIPPNNPLMAAAAAALSEQIWPDNDSGSGISSSATRILCVMACDEGRPNESVATGAELPSRTDMPPGLLSPGGIGVADNAVSLSKR